MILLETLKDRESKLESYFQAHLMREDIARIERLVDLAGKAPDQAAFIKEGMCVGWTPGDMQTFKMRDTLEAFLKTFLAHHSGKTGDDALMAAWEDFHRDRLAKLVGCL